MKPLVSIIDYGVGNLFSVSRAFEESGADVVFISTPEEVIDADRLVLPGVGAFADGMAELRARNLVEPIRAYAKTGRPFLGICLGMQMMLSRSEEFGSHEGLGLIPGKVVQIANVTTDGEPLKIPHIGWNALLPPTKATAWEGTILESVYPQSYVYFVHSFVAQPEQPEHLLAVTHYGGHALAAALASGCIYGCQFHPERSGRIGLDIIRDFLNCPASSVPNV